MPRPVSNPPNPWESTHVEYLGEPPAARLEVFEELARSVLSKNESPDIPFRYSVNPYRGCQHACAYCYARPSHQYLGFGAGTDFDKKIVVKTNAAEVLRQLARRSWRNESITFSGNTDCYQPLEASYGLTRACLKACAERRNPVAIITKSALVRRDLDLLIEAARVARARVFFSIPFAHPNACRAIEPGAPSPAARFEAMAALTQAGIPCGVAVAPLIPGLNESEIPAILERARAAGATSAFLTLLRLPGEVEGVFRARLEEALPERARRVLSGLVDARGGRLKDAAFGDRMRGRGPRWDAITGVFSLHCRRLGLETGRAADDREQRLAALQAEVAGREEARQGLLFEDPHSA